MSKNDLFKEESKFLDTQAYRGYDIAQTILLIVGHKAIKRYNKHSSKDPERKSFCIYF
jgi:hypothetical protein